MLYTANKKAVQSFSRDTSLLRFNLKSKNLRQHWQICAGAFLNKRPLQCNLLPYNNVTIEKFCCNPIFDCKKRVAFPSHSWIINQESGRVKEIYNVWKEFGLFIFILTVCLETKNIFLPHKFSLFFCRVLGFDLSDR